MRSSLLTRGPEAQMPTGNVYIVPEPQPAHTCSSALKRCHYSRIDFACSPGLVGSARKWKMFSLPPSGIKQRSFQIRPPTPLLFLIFPKNSVSNEQRGREEGPKIEITCTNPQMLQQFKNKYLESVRSCAMKSITSSCFISAAVNHWDCRAQSCDFQ